MHMVPAAGYRSLRAPQQDGQALIDPPLADLPETVNANRLQLAARDYDMQGRSLRLLAADARRALVHRAADYTEQYRTVPERVRFNPSVAEGPVILSGHQPQLFHPGVWYKNFVLGESARGLSGVGIHLLIDSDLCRSASIRVPVGTVQQPRLEAVTYDQSAADVPYEERAVNDLATFASFGERVTQAIAPLVPDPLVGPMWSTLMARRPSSRNLGLWLARGRHAYEETWQNETLELPLSAVCQLSEFAWFVAHLLAQLPRFWTAHNDALAEFRRLHRIHNRVQPIPDLAAADGWYESPFWIWSSRDPRRRPLFARHSNGGVTITDRNAQTLCLELSPDGDASRAVEQLMELPARDIKIRTRQLTTTLFARLVLGDIFLHGIGGARYDQVTDRIAKQFFGIPLPAFATVSATLRLPIAHDRASATSDSQLRQQLREMRYHPERFLERDGVRHASEPGGVGDMMAAKRQWVNTRKTVENARQRHLAIEAANLALQRHLHDSVIHIEQQRIELAVQRRASAILESREYAFCLYPRRHMDWLLQRSPQAPNAV